MTSVEASWRMTGASDRDPDVVQRDDVVRGVELAVGPGVARVPGPLVRVDLDADGVGSALDRSKFQKAALRSMVELTKRLPSTTKKMTAESAERDLHRCLRVAVVVLGRVLLVVLDARQSIQTHMMTKRMMMKTPRDLDEPVDVVTVLGDVARQAPPRLGLGRRAGQARSRGWRRDRREKPC